MKDKKYLFEKASVPRALAVMALPSIASQLIILIYNIADTWFIGRTDNKYMVAACSLVLPVFMLTIVIANIFGAGGGTLIARLIGRGENEEASRVSSACVWMAFASAAFFSLACFLSMTPLLRLLGASSNTFDYAKQYMLCVVVLGGVPSILSSTLSAMLRSIGMSSKASFGLSMGGILNIALDPLFMFVILPDGEQVLGAAIATMLSNFVSLLYFVIVYGKACKSTILRFRMKKRYPSGRSFGSVFGVGIPAATSILLFDICNMIINKLAAAHSDTDLAAISIVLKVERLPLNIGVGLCIGMVPLLAYNYSSGDHDRMDRIFGFARLVGLSISVVSVAMYFFLSPSIIHAFINEPETVRLGTQFLKARCFATPVMFLCFSMVHFTQAIGRGVASFALALIRQVVFNIPILLIMDHLFGMTGIVWTQAIADLLTAVVSYIIYEHIRKKMGWKIKL